MNIMQWNLDNSNLFGSQRFRLIEVSTNRVLNKRKFDVQRLFRNEENFRLKVVFDLSRFHCIGENLIAKFTHVYLYNSIRGIQKFSAPRLHVIEIFLINNGIKYSNSFLDCSNNKKSTISFLNFANKNVASFQISIIIVFSSRVEIEILFCPFPSGNIRGHRTCL